MFDTKALAAATALIVREHVAAALEPVLAEIAALRARLDAIEGREAPALDTEAVDAIVRDAIATLPAPKNGKDAEVDMSLVGLLVDEAVAQKIAGVEPAKVDMVEVEALVRNAVAALPAPRNGKDAEVDMAAVALLIDDSVTRHMAEMPGPKDGDSVTLDDVRPLVDEAVGKAMSAIPVPNDGVGLAGALIDRGGNLVVTLTDGSLRDLGPVVGRDCDPVALGEAVREAVAAIPVPKDGDPGKDADPAVIKQLVDEAVARIPAPKDGKDAYPGEARGLFDPTATYRALDVVSLNGCEWRAKTDDPGLLPGDGWMLSAQRGKPGKPAAAPPAIAGKDGASIIAGAFDPDAMQLTLARDDGEAFTIDFLPLAEAIREG